MKKFSTSIVMAFVLWAISLGLFPTDAKADIDSVYVDTSMYASKIYLQVHDIKTPTIVQFKSRELTGENRIIILEEESLLPQQLSIQTLFGENRVYLMTDQLGRDMPKLHDYDKSTFEAFNLAATIQTQTPILIEYLTFHEADELRLDLADNVQPPQRIQLEVQNGETWTTVINNTTYSQTINFPKTQSKVWRLTITHNEPMRLSEVKLDSSIKTDMHYEIRFLAKPNETYTAYINPSISQNNAPLLYENYKNEKNPLSISTRVVRNPQYVEPDSDGDGVLNNVDNCPNSQNTDQIDANGNNVGDVCEDYDKDGIDNRFDNCMDKPNSDQANVDGDAFGDVCDPEESRFTEKYPWLPWLGIGYVVVMTAALFIVTARKKS